MNILFFILMLYFSIVQNVFAEETGFLKVDSIPSDAQLAINGKLKGNTPLTIELSVGTYKLTVSKQFYQEKSLSINIEKDIVKKIQVELIRGGEWKETPATGVTVSRGVGKLTIIADIEGAEIYVDDKKAQYPTPNTLEDVISGPHNVRVSYNSVSESQAIVLHPGEVKVIRFALLDKVRDFEVGQNKLRQEAIQRENKTQIEKLINEIKNTNNIDFIINTPECIQKGSFVRTDRVGKYFQDDNGKYNYLPVLYSQKIIELKDKEQDSKVLKIENWALSQRYGDFKGLVTTNYDLKEEIECIFKIFMNNQEIGSFVRKGNLEYKFSAQIWGNSPLNFTYKNGNENQQFNETLTAYPVKITLYKANESPFSLAIKVILETLPEAIPTIP